MRPHESEPRASRALVKPASPPAAESRVEELGVCSTQRFDVSLRKGRVSLTDRGAELAFASYDDWDVLPACTPNTKERRMTARVIRKVARLYSDKELGDGVYEAVTVACEAPSPVELSVHPVWDERGEIIGSSLAVAAHVKGVLELLVTAGLKPGWDRLHYAARYCERV